MFLSYYTSDKLNIKRARVENIIQILIKNLLQREALGHGSGSPGLRLISSCCDCSVVNTVEILSTSKTDNGKQH